MPKRKRKALTDEQFVSSILSRLKFNGKYFVLYGEFEPGHGSHFIDDAYRLCRICRDNGGKADVVQECGWWNSFELFSKALQANYINHTIISLSGIFASRIKALISSQRH